MATETMTRPCPNVQCPNMIDFTEAECTTCWDARPLSERVALAKETYPDAPMLDNRSFN